METVPQGMSSTASSTMPLGSTASVVAAEMTTDVNSIVEKLQELSKILSIHAVQSEFNEFIYIHRFYHQVENPF